MVERGIMKAYMWMALMPLIISQFFKQFDTDAKKKKRFCVICGFILIIVLGTRSKFVGSSDTYNYCNMMQRAVEASSWSQFYIEGPVEKGFQFFLWGFSKVFKDPQWLIFISSAIYVTCIMIFIYRYSKDVCLSTVMYICLGLMTFNMQGMRQSIAMSICLLAYDLAKNKRLIPFVILVTLASRIHQTAIVFFAIYILSFVKFKPSHIIMLIIGIFVFVMLSDKLINFANELFEREYFDAKDSGGFVATAIYALIIGFSLCLSKRPIKDNIDSMMFFTLVVGFICYIERYIAAFVAERISFYFAAAQIIILPNAIHDSTIANRESQFIAIIVYCLCLALFAYRLSGSNLIPFRFFWMLQN